MKSAEQIKERIKELKSENKIIHIKQSMLTGKESNNIFSLIVADVAITAKIRVLEWVLED